MNGSSRGDACMAAGTQIRQLASGLPHLLDPLPLLFQQVALHQVLGADSLGLLVQLVVIAVRCSERERAGQCRGGVGVGRGVECR